MCWVCVVCRFTPSLKKAISKRLFFLSGYKFSCNSWELANNEPTTTTSAVIFSWRWRWCKDNKEEADKEEEREKEFCQNGQCTLCTWHKQQRHQHQRHDNDNYCEWFDLSSGLANCSWPDIGMRCCCKICILARPFICWSALGLKSQPTNKTVGQ